MRNYATGRRFLAKMQAIASLPRLTVAIKFTALQQTNQLPYNSEFRTPHSELN